MKHGIPALMASCFFLACLAAQEQPTPTVVGKWNKDDTKGISFEFLANGMGVMQVFGVNARFGWQKKDNAYYLLFPGEKMADKAVMAKDGKKLLYFGKKERNDPEFTLQRVE